MYDASLIFKSDTSNRENFCPIFMIIYVKMIEQCGLWLKRRRESILAIDIIEWRILY